MADLVPLRSFSENGHKRLYFAHHSRFALQERFHYRYPP